MKKLINKPEDVVREALQGIAIAHADLVKVCYEPNYIVRADAPVKGKVGVISGGGSGHEPMHGGFVGLGMLDAACPGEVFTSPTPDQMLEATKAVSGGAGVLHIVKNYTGDVLNFEMAAELAGAEGIEVEAVVTDDDVAVKDSLYTAGRRGVGVTVLIEKIVGAAAEQHRPLKDVRLPQSIVVSPFAIFWAPERRKDFKPSRAAWLRILTMSPSCPTSARIASVITSISINPVRRM